MTSSTRNHLLALAVAAAALGVPTAAGAATFCVGPVDCPAGATPMGTSLQGALNAAHTNVGTFDTILVGDKGSPYAGPLEYVGRTEAGTPDDHLPTVEIKGVGATPPRLTAGAGETVLKLFRARVSNVAIANGPDQSTGLFGRAARRRRSRSPSSRRRRRPARRWPCRRRRPTTIATT